MSVAPPTRLETVGNIAVHLPRMALQRPDQKGVIAPARRAHQGGARWVDWTFEQLDHNSDRFAHALTEAGIGSGDRVLLMVRPGLDFIGLTFALFKMGAVPILIDPGMGKKNLLTCIREVEPHAMVAVPLAHAIRTLVGRRFPPIRVSVTVGRRWFWGGVALAALTPSAWTRFPLVETQETDPAAIIFTTGSTGIPKGVLYEHGMFQAQVEWLRKRYAIEPGETDVAGFPLFALFNVALGVTTVVPDMDPTRPARVDPARFVAAITEHRATQSFGSPAIWKRVGAYCVEQGIRLPSLRRVLMAGAPVPPDLLEPLDQVLEPSAAAHTPYGATEALPVASIDHHEVLGETAERTRQGAGACVGTPFDGVTVRIIAIREEPIERWTADLQLPVGQIGEIVVRGAVVTRRYFNRQGSTKLAKIPDGDAVWHRMGDVGYVDEQGRLWYCGRMAHRVRTASGPMFTVCCEAIFNAHAQVARSALVGIGPANDQTPVLVAEPITGAFPVKREAAERFTAELLELGAANERTKGIRHVLFHRSFPVDIRHNAKIFREKLAPWAEKRLRRALRQTASEAIPGERRV